MSKIKRGLIVIAVLGSVMALLWQLGFFGLVVHGGEFQANLGGYTAYIGTYIVAQLTIFAPLGFLIVGMSLVAEPLAVIVLTFIANFIAGMLLYLIGMYGAKNLIQWVFGSEKAIEKWQKVMEKGKYTIFLMILFPFSPNQLIMILCGSGKMRLRTYITILTVGQMFGIATIVYLTKFISVLQPLWLWGSIMGLLLVSAMYLSFKYQDKIDNFFKKLKR